MSSPKPTTRLLRFVWGLVPWVFVAALVLFVLNLAGEISAKNAALEETKKAALKQAIPATKVITLLAEPKTLTDKINLPAEIQPFEELRVRAEVPGQVVKVYVEEGQTVKRGQVLMRLDDSDYKTKLDRIKANYELAKSSYKRTASLAKKQVAAQTQLEDIEAQVKDLEAQLADAKLALARTAITAPINGRLNELVVNSGDYVGMAQEVAQILQIDQVKVTVGVPESDVAAVFDLNEAEATIDALDGLKVVGKKKFLSRQPSSLARLYDLELVIDNPDGRILPGMFARVELVKHIFPGALVVPLYAVITENDQNYIYIEKDNKAVKRFVEMGILEGWQVQVTKGLRPMDKVIILGHRLLEDGQAVEVLKTVRDPKEILAS